MKVTVVCFGMLREQLPPNAQGNSVDVEVGPGSTVSTLLSDLRMDERSVFSLLINGIRSQTSQVLHDGDEVTFMPPFSGG